ncbi:MAC/Perforin domain protein [Theileria parva strain Muguga]|uniref:MACPF domain-containing protein n=1 Tax=Theileria parva TaxID=5875 RepID=Q4MYN1_THEPA|nr:MAC/Perforin domain protein [Theileria parva strain Muguga]EAN30651.1 MAC/Perforin domain protein [Theileria parva strain Muguga]|eukprot:XP_762934.1 hypothetical protein [Theileria parva strain Muguga]
MYTTLFFILFTVYTRCFCVILPENYHNNTQRTDYLNSHVGFGFDLVEGNPLDSFNDLNTFGFRSPIIVQPYITRDIGNIIIKRNNGIWVRKSNNCTQNYEPRDIERGSDLVRELFNDFSLDSPFSEELWNRNSKGLGLNDITFNKSKFKIVKCYCSLYESGLITPFHGELRGEFVEMVGKLPNTVESTECPIDIFITELESCKNLRIWINLFKTYGTHITTYAMTGGKFINMESVVNINLQARDSDIKNTKAKRTGEASSEFSEIFRRRIKGNKIKKHLWVIGGSFVNNLEQIDPKMFSKWVKTIDKRPMPIKARFSELSMFFPEKHETYMKAVEYYEQISGIKKLNN